MFTWKDKKLDSVKGAKGLANNTTAYAVLLVAIGATGLFGVISPQSCTGPTGLSGDAAKVAGQNVSFEEFRRSYDSMYQQYSRVYQESFDPSSMKLADSVLKQLVNERVVFEQAKQAGFATSKEEAEDIIYEDFTDAKTKKFDAEQFSNALRANGYTESSYTEQVRRAMTNMRFRRFASDNNIYASAFVDLDYKLSDTKLDVDYLRLNKDSVKVSVTATEIAEFLKSEENKKKVETYYKSNAADYKKAAKVKASHILISFKGTRRPSKEAEARSKDQAQALATKILAEVKAPKADFAALAKKYTDEASGKDKGGDLGFFEREGMVKPFSDKAFAMKVGEISDVVETEFGFHIIKVTDLQAAVDKKLEDAQNSIAEILLKDSRVPEVLQRRADTILADLKAGKNVQPLLKEYGVEWKSTGEFALDARSIPTLGSDEAVIEATYKLNQPGELYPSVVTVGDYRIILRLKKKAEPSERPDVKRTEELASTGVNSFGGELFRVTNKEFEDALRKEGKIHIEEKFLAIDQRNAKQGG